MGIIGLPLGPLMGFGILLGLLGFALNLHVWEEGAAGSITAPSNGSQNLWLVFSGSHRADADDDCRWIFPRVALKLNEVKSSKVPVDAHSSS